MSVDDSWFSELRGVEFPDPLKPADFPDRESIRAYWDNVEQNMREYLAGLRDDMLFDKPLEGENRRYAVQVKIGALTGETA